jgi:DNA-binding response OmpR family regulator
MKDSHLLASQFTLMVVDDNPDLVDILRITLEEKEFNVRCAYSGREVFAGLEEKKPDLIILDIMMPQMDGLEVLTRLRENPDTASIPVIFLTAKALYDDVIRGYKTGAEYYITKPFTNSQLFTGINLLLGVPDTPPSQTRASPLTQPG